VRVLVTGAGGLVGGALCVALTSNHQVHGTVRSRAVPSGVTGHQVELSEPGEFARLVERIRPDCVVHAAYSTAHLERDVVRATEQVASGCARHGVRLINLSTDAVFDGEHAPYAETDRPEPVHAYGRAKRDAELLVRATVPDGSIVRTALIAHLDANCPDTATQWMLDAQRRGDPVTLFVDEIRTVVRLDDLVDTLAELVALDPGRCSGVWHVAGPDRLSRWDLGQIVADRLGLDRSLLIPGRASSMGEPRPRDVSLSCDRLAGELSSRPRPVATVPPHGQATG
jgi:dTDP-4-dehydrorhamnose reductase